MEKKTGHVFQNTGLKKHRQELMNTPNGEFTDFTALGILEQKNILGFSMERKTLN